MKQVYGLSWMALAMLGVAALAPACGNSETKAGAGGAGQTSGSMANGTGDTGSGTQSTAALGSSCNPECTPPQFCSAKGHCLAAGTCEDDLDCTDGKVCDLPTSTCVPGGACGGQAADTTPIPPNLLIVLDRSCSMKSKIGGKSKWEIAVEALNGLTTTYSGQIRFGITFFPDVDGTSCAQGAIAVDCGPGNETAIQTLLTNSLQSSDALYPDGPCVTNIDTAMLQAQAEPAFTDTTRQSYALLLTDGEQAGCNAGGGDNGTLAAIAQMLGATPSVPTFVIGFGAEADPVTLGQFADAGGVPNPMGPPSFFDAADETSLEAALDLIANKTIGCEFSLDSVPPDPSKIYVFLDNDSLANDPTNGWTYDPTTNTVTFHGTSCESLKDGTVTDVDVVFGCNQPVPD